jgi:uncharacterized membrane protein YcgQ (UPF0703/DUF1980 family)
MRKDFDGKQVAMIGQVAHRKNAQYERGPAQLVRFVMVYCAADVQPCSYGQYRLPQIEVNELGQ